MIDIRGSLQEELILDSYYRKIEKIDQDLLRDGIGHMYSELLGLAMPSITVVNGMHDLLSWHNWNHPINSLRIESSAREKVVTPVLDQVKLHLNRRHTQNIYDSLPNTSVSNQYENIRYYLTRKKGNSFSPDLLLPSIVFAEVLNSRDVKTIAYHNYKKLLHSGAFQLYCWERHVAVLPAPTLKYNSDLQIHSTVGPAVRWPDGSGLYYIHGQHMPEWIYVDYKNDDYVQRFVALDNQRVRIGIVTLLLEREGIAAVRRFLFRAFSHARHLDNSNK